MRKHLTLLKKDHRKKFESGLLFIKHFEQYFVIFNINFYNDNVIAENLYSYKYNDKYHLLLITCKNYFFCILLSISLNGLNSRKKLPITIQ